MYAQRGSDASALAPGAVAESLAVIAELQRRVRADPRDAAAWHRIGIVAWALAERARFPGAPRELNAPRFNRMADTSLRIAAEVAPTNARYRLALGHFLLSSTGAILTRVASYGEFEKALTIARAGADRELHAEAAIEYGRTHWRRFDALVNRRLTTEPGAIVRSLADALQPLARLAGADPDPSGFLDADPSRVPAAPGQATGTPASQTVRSFINARPTEASIDERGLTPAYVTLRTAREMIESKSQALPREVTGQRDYDRALALFREAYEAAPGDPRTFFSVAMALAERARWQELEHFATQHVSQFAGDAWGWMARGLSAVRQRHGDPAMAAFDSALARMDAATRARIDRIERVMRRSERSRYIDRGAAERSEIEALFWRLADPLWGKTGNDARLEFLARVTYAELRWTVPELGVRGADSDRGDAFIRYGPPEITVVFGPTPDSEGNAVTTIWIYDWGLILTFAGTPTYGTARIPFSDQAWVDALVEAQPVRWQPAAEVDSLATRVARFRAADQSVDLLIASRAPDRSAATRTGVPAPARADLWVLDRYAQTLYRDSSTLGEADVWTWTGRVQRGEYLYRVETTGDSARRAGRTMVSLGVTYDPTTSVPVAGFGLSDVLLVTRADPRVPHPRRWSDLDLQPLVGALPRGAPLAIVWETYDVAEREGSASYEVALTIQRERSGGGRVTANLLGALATIARIDRRDDRAVITFDRTMPHADALVDQLDIDLADTPAGAYTVTLQIRDRVNGHVATRATRVVVRDERN
jgi:GWxTD domain-containing protein